MMTQWAKTDTVEVGLNRDAKLSWRMSLLVLSFHSFIFSGAEP
jgi:hypothetical protein